MWNIVVNNLIVIFLYMFIGRYYHHLEEKGRLSLPKEFRTQHQNWVITRGLEGGLFLLPFDEFNKQLELISGNTFIKKNQRDMTRLLTNDAREVKPDSLGRITLPEYLIQQAELKKQVVIIGSFHYIEIWDQEKYHQYLAKIEPQSEKLAESIEITAKIVND